MDELSVQLRLIITTAEILNKPELENWLSWNFKTVTFLLQEQILTFMLQFFCRPKLIHGNMVFLDKVSAGIGAGEVCFMHPALDTPANKKSLTTDLQSVLWRIINAWS